MPSAGGRAVRGAGGRRAARALGALVVTCVLVAGVLVAAGSPARAAFPGINGLIVFQSNRDGHDEIYVRNSGGGGQTRLTDSFASEQPSWSADGTKIAFVSRHDGGTDIAVMDADGLNQIHLDAPGTPTGQAPAWSPDGTKLAIASYSDVTHDYDIWV